jgi:hypothetical protein
MQTLLLILFLAPIPISAFLFFLYELVEDMHFAYMFSGWYPKKRWQRWLLEHTW